MPFTAVDAGRIYWKREGQAGAPPLVLLNSIGTDIDLWGETLPALRARYSLLRIDTRGHGASDAPAGDYRLADLAADVAAVMDAAEIGRAHLAGVSLGAMIAMQMALDLPHRVERLALVCTSAAMDAAAWAERVERVRGEGMAGIAELALGRFFSPAFARARPEIVATVGQGLLSMSPAGYAGCAAAIRDMALIQRLGAIAAPTLVVTGQRDASTPFVGHGEHLLAIPGARHGALDSGHLAPLEVPEALVRLLSPFLDA